jgi:hypothetical protein
VPWRLYASGRIIVLWDRAYGSKFFLWCIYVFLIAKEIRFFATLWRLLCPCLQPLGSLAVGLEFHGGSCRLLAVGATEPLNYWYWCAGVGEDPRVLFPFHCESLLRPIWVHIGIGAPCYFCCCIAQRRFWYHRDLCGFFLHLFLLGRIVLRPSLLYHLQQ